MIATFTGHDVGGSDESKIWRFVKLPYLHRRRPNYYYNMIQPVYRSSSPSRSILFTINLSERKIRRFVMLPYLHRRRPNYYHNMIQPVYRCSSPSRSILFTINLSERIPSPVVSTRFVYSTTRRGVVRLLVFNTDPQSVSFRFCSSD